ncbi:porin [Acinetobacter sp. RIT698]|uniref:porin n=1 Tax=Acinetobacter sp. RIT698 TaxID=2666192 RepID=UPI0012ACA9B7|nr:porin [Acinetobacter sp. RIT698]MRT38071.1 porin [Acinetobacter sp. RIT698]
MLKRTLKIVCSTWVILNATTVSAEVELIHQDQIFSDQDSFTVKTHGSMRLQALNFDQYNANNQSQKYRRNGYSAASRMYLDLDYKLDENTHLIAGYQNYFNLPKIFDWDGHYAKNDEEFTTIQAYVGMENSQYGTLKFGKMYSIYHDVVGVKTDLWDYDMLGQVSTWSPFSFHDGTLVSSKTLRYEKKNQYVDFYAAYLFGDETSLNNFHYKLKSGEEIATDVHLSKNLHWGTSYKHNQVSLSDSQDNHDLSQHVIATALYYFDGQWMWGVGAGWYKNLVPNNLARNQPAPYGVEHYLDTEAYGIEYYAGYKFKVQNYGIQSIQPYVMGDHIKYTQGEDFSRRDLGVGMALRFNYGIGFDYERLYTSDSKATPDLHLFRLRYQW